MNIAATAERFIIKSIRQGLSANETLTMLRGAGLGYRRQDFLTDYSRLAQLPRKSDVLKNINLYSRPSPRTMVQGGDWMLRQYRYVTKITMLIPSSGDTVTMYKTLSSDDLMNRNDIEQSALDNATQYEGQSQPVVQSIQLHQAFYRSDASFE